MLDVLRSAEIFATTPERALHDIAALLTPLSLGADEPIFAKGDAGDCLYLVASGRVQVHVGSKVLDELGPGEIFGEMALLDRETRSASVTTAEPSLLYRLDQGPFYGLLEARPEVCREIIKLLSQRLRAQMKSSADDHRYIAQLYQASREAERMASELALASKVQSSFLPQSAPQISGWDIAAGWQPARELSGDFYDFFPLEGALGFVIADVADKGMPAALFMALTRSVLRSSVSATRPPERSIARANRLLCADASDGMFVTLFYGQLEKNGALRYVNAGHNPPLLFRRGQSSPEALSRTGIVIGWDEDASFGAEARTLSAGDSLLLYTDGVTEALNSKGEEYGEARLEAFFREREGNAADLVRCLQEELEAFTGGAPPHDDMTVLVIKRH